MKKAKYAPDRIKEMLPCSAILAIANRISAEFGLPEAPRGAIRHMYDENDLPLIYVNKKGRLWVDKYYIAYSLRDEVVRYVYLTHRHIKEEYQSYASAAKARKETLQMPAEIKRAFDRAAGVMFLKERKVWTEKNIYKNPVSVQK